MSSAEHDAPSEYDYLFEDGLGGSDSTDSPVADASTLNLDEAFGTLKSDNPFLTAWSELPKIDDDQQLSSNPQVGSLNVSNVSNLEEARHLSQAIEAIFNFDVNYSSLPEQDTTSVNAISLSQPLSLVTPVVEQVMVPKSPNVQEPMALPSAIIPSATDLTSVVGANDTNTRSPSVLYMDDSSPASDHGPKPSRRSSRAPPHPQHETHGFQLQPFRIPPLCVFGRRLGNEDDPTIDHPPRFSEMLPYPDEIPVITLGRGKKNTRSISQMSEGEMKEALSGSKPSMDQDLSQQQAIKEWSGACSSALGMEMAGYAQFPTINEPSSTSNGRPIISLGKHTTASMAVHDWNTKNKLHLTVKTKTKPSKAGEAPHPSHIPLPPSSASSQTPYLASTQAQAFGAHPHQHHHSLLTPGYDLMMGAIRSAPAVCFGSGQTNAGYFSTAQQQTVAAPPLSASWIASNRAIPECEVRVTPYAPYQAQAPGSVPELAYFDLSQPLEPSAPSGLDLSLLYGLPSPCVGPESNVYGPQVSQSGSGTHGSEYHQVKPMHKFEHMKVPTRLATPPLSAGLRSKSFESGFGLGESQDVNHTGTDDEVNLEMVSQLMTQEHLNPNANFNSKPFQEIQLHEAGERRGIDQWTLFGNDERVRKQPSLDHQAGPQSMTMMNQLGIHSMIKKPKLSISGSRLKPGPKSKSTLIQHPPLPNHRMSSLDGFEPLGIPKEVIQRMYEAFYDQGEDGKPLKRYVCRIEQCARVFPRKTAIESHIQTHLEDKPFVCLVQNCNAAFVRQHDLRRHQQIHSGTKPYNCQCGKGFARGDALMRHRQRGICVGSMIPRRC